MKRAFTATEKSILRTKPQSTEWYLAVYRPASVLQGRLNAKPTTFSGSGIVLNSVTGNFTSVVEGMTLINGGTVIGGSSKGKLRVKSATGGTSTLKIAEYGCALINWAANDYITVLKEFRPWVKFPRFDTGASRYDMDFDKRHSGSFSNLRPIPIMGPPIIAKDFNASMIGSSSVFFGGTLTTTQWLTYDGASPLAGYNLTSIGTAAAPTVIQIPQRPDGTVLGLKVTDSNGLSGMTHRIAFGYPSPATSALADVQLSEYLKVEFGEIVGGYKNGGYLASFTVRGNQNATLALVPDEAQIIVFEANAQYGDTTSEIGGNYPLAERVVFSGYILNETQTINPFDNAITFQAATIDQILVQQEAFDVFLAEYINGASGWQEITGLTLDKAAHHIIAERSTISEVCDFNFANGIGSQANLILFQALPRESIFRQLQDNYGDYGFLGYVSSDMQGNLHAFEEVQITGNSNNLVNVMDIAYNDRMNAVVIQKKHQENVSESLFSAVASDTPYFAVAPKYAPGYFGTRRSVEKSLTGLQNNVNVWSGNYRAKENNEYPRTVVPLVGNYKIDSVPQSRVTMSLSAVDNTRGISWNNDVFFPYLTKISYNSLARYATTELELEKKVNGMTGASFVPPSVSPGDTTFPPIPPSPPNPPDPPGQGDGFGTVYVMGAQAFGRTRDFSASPPTWTNIGAAVAGKDLYDFILDPWNPTTTGYLMAEDGLYKSTNLDVASPTFTQILSSTAIETAVSADSASFNSPYKIIASINVNGYVGFAFKVTLSTVPYIYYARSSNSGTSWSYSQIVGGAESSITTYTGGLDYVPHLVNGNVRLYLACGYLRNAFNKNRKIYRSDNGGATWTLKQGPGDLGLGSDDPRGGICVHCPYDGNESGNKFYAAWEVRAGDAIVYSDDGGDTISIINLISNYDGLESHRTPIESYTQDETSLYCWTGDSSDSHHLLYSSDAGANWTEKFAFGTTPEKPQILASGGFPYNNSLFYALLSSTNGGTSGIYVSTNQGTSFTNKSGTFATSVGEIRGTPLNGRGTIVPVWVQE